MRNKILLVLFAILTSFFILTLSVNASETCVHENKEVTSVEYADYAQNGKIKFVCSSCDVTEKEVKPLLKLNGYSISNDGNSICTGYTINSEALFEITKLNDKFEIGMVAAAKSLLGDKMPLDSQTAQPVDLSQYGASVIKVNITGGNYSLVDLRLNGFDALTSFEQLYLTAYTFDGKQVKYIQGSTKDTASKISYVMIENPEDVVIDGVSFSLFEPNSTTANDRQKQTNASNADFNAGSSKTQDELNGIVNETDLITNGFTALIYPNASSYMKHYLSASGADYIIDMGTGRKGFFKSSSETTTHRNTRISQAMRAAEQLAMEGGRIDIYQKTEQVNHFSSSTDDWRLSVGSYFTCINMLNVTVTIGADGTKTYSADVEYNVADFYNWNEWDYNRQLKDILPSPHDLHQLHKAGMAKEFTSKGTVTYPITWTEGQSFSDVY